MSKKSSPATTTRVCAVIALRGATSFSISAWPNSQTCASKPKLARRSTNASDHRWLRNACTSAAPSALSRTTSSAAFSSKMVAPSRAGPRDLPTPASAICAACKALSWRLMSGKPSHTKPLKKSCRLSRVGTQPVAPICSSYAAPSGSALCGTKDSGRPAWLRRPRAAACALKPAMTLSPSMARSPSDAGGRVASKDCDSVVIDSDPAASRTESYHGCDQSIAANMPGAPNTLLSHLPVDGFAGVERHHLLVGQRQQLGQRPLFARQRDGAAVARQAVESGTVETGEAFQFV